MSTNSKAIRWYFFSVIETLVSATSGFDSFLNEAIALGKSKSTDRLQELFGDYTYDPTQPESVFLQRMRATSNKQGSGSKPCAADLRWNNTPFPLNVAFRSLPVNAMVEYGHELLLMNRDTLVIPWPLPARTSSQQADLATYVTPEVQVPALTLQEYKDALPLRSLLMVTDILQIMGNNGSRNGAGEYLASMANPVPGTTTTDVFRYFEENLIAEFREWLPWAVHASIADPATFKVEYVDGMSSVETEIVIPNQPTDPVVLRIGRDYQKSSCLEAYNTYMYAHRVKESIAPIPAGLRHKLLAIQPSATDESLVIIMQCLATNALGCMPVTNYHAATTRMPRWMREVRDLALPV
ncbi:MAG: hypothetical protein AAGJ10_08270 [Bacteroidota bacterium]